MRLSLLLILLLFPTASGQSVVETVKVSIVCAGEKPTDGEFCDLLRGELNKLKYVAIVSPKRRDFDIWFATAPFTGGDNVVGYAAAILAINVDTGRFDLTVKTGPSLSGIAKQVAAQLDREVFAKKAKR